MSTSSLQHPGRGETRYGGGADHPDPKCTVSGAVSVALPVPGHTGGSVLYLFDGHLLFSGDSLGAERDGSGLIAFRDACWYSWPTQQASLAVSRRASTALIGCSAATAGVEMVASKSYTTT